MTAVVAIVAIVVLGALCAWLIWLLVGRRDDIAVQQLAEVREIRRMGDR